MLVRRSTGPPDSFGPNTTYSNDQQTSQDNDNDSQRCDSKCMPMTLAIAFSAIALFILGLLVYILWQRRRERKERQRVQDAVRAEQGRLKSKTSVESGWESVTTLKKGASEASVRHIETSKDRRRLGSKTARHEKWWGALRIGR